MRVRWAPRAADDLEDITNYLFDSTPAHAERLVRSLYDAISGLKVFPNRGRPGKKLGTRELVLRSLPFIVVYQVKNDVVHVARILHGAQKWPD